MEAAKGDLWLANLSQVPALLADTATLQSTGFLDCPSTGAQGPLPLDDPSVMDEDARASQAATYCLALARHRVATLLFHTS
eukprot:10379293-Lingulodinium_polyedra.AAC.1